jgi:hypothetical protein
VLAIVIHTSRARSLRRQRKPLPASASIHFTEVASVGVAVDIVDVERNLPEALGLHQMLELSRKTGIRASACLNGRAQRRR